VRKTIILKLSSPLFFGHLRTLFILLRIQEFYSSPILKPTMYFQQEWRLLPRTKEIIEFAFEVEPSRQASIHLKKCTYEDFTYQRDENVVPSNIPTNIVLVMPQEMPRFSIGVATITTRCRARARATYEGQGRGQGRGRGRGLLEKSNAYSRLD
jgi:hypothetical protein